MPTTHRRTSARFRDASARTPGTDEELTLDVPCDEDAPSAARDLLRALDGEGWAVSDAMLVASELTTNAVRHSGGGKDDFLTVDVRIGHGRVLIAVVDPGLSGTSARPRPGGGDLGGFGLQLVDKLAARWGSERTDRHRVWAELALSG